ncbi:MAG: C40 family peptidase [Prevotella sp.]|nr:C40 family peptidase [Prevotella sp.]
MNLNKTIISFLFGLSVVVPSFAAQEVVVGGEEEAKEVNSFLGTMGEQLLTNAKKYIGRPYRRGSNGPRAFDCSGFTKYVFNTMNVTLNRTSRAQFTQGTSVSRSEVRVGDLVFFKSAHSGNGVGHVGIVFSVDDDGSFKFIHASCHKGVTISSIKEGYYARRYKGARRIVNF